MKHSILFILIGLVASSIGFAKMTKSMAQLTPVDELTWEADSKGGPTTSIQATDTKTGGFHGFHKFAKGASFPMHTHTANIYGTVVAGTFAMGIEGSPEKQLGPGSYVYLPGNAKHTTKCVSDSDCVLFAQYTGKFDVKMTSEHKN